MNIYLPSDTRVSDVVDVMGILIGNTKHKEPLSGDGWFCSVDNVGGHDSIDFNEEPIKNRNIYLMSYNGVPSMVTIKIVKNNLDRLIHECSYHFEGSSGKREMICYDSEFWMKVGTELIKFFGGRVEFDDSKMENITIKKPRRSNSPEDNKPWQDFQQAMFDLQPLK